SPQRRADTVFCYNFSGGMITLFGKPEPTLTERLKASVTKTKAAMADAVDNLFLGGRQIDPKVLKQLETALLSADLGVKTTREVLDSVREKIDRNALSDSAQLKREIKADIARCSRARTARARIFW